MTKVYTLVYGLSANPVHEGHVTLVVQALQGLLARGFDVTRALLIPVYRRNPVCAQKDDVTATYAERLRLCELAAAEISARLDDADVAVEVSEIEARLARGRETPNYTVETLGALQVMGYAPLIFLMSSDLFSGEDPELARWHRPDRLLDLATLALCPRPGYPPNQDYLAELESQGAQIVYLEDVRTPEISSSELRARLATGTPPLALLEKGVLPDSVALYLAAHNFYKPDV
jgi:nicotinate-nucleotide adenylyltransferase